MMICHLGDLQDASIVGGSDPESFFQTRSFYNASSAIPLEQV